HGVMPGPLGQQPRDRKFLLRMTAPEDDFVRERARSRTTSLNDAIASLIADAMAAEQTPPAPPPPAPAQAPAPEPKTPRRKLRTPTRSTASLARDLTGPNADRTPGPGQTAVPVDE
ncbi:hypothetical protein ACWGIV_37005, partial [Streptomyces sp. NPDC054844]